MKSLDGASELGRTPAYVSRYWRPVQPLECAYCGSRKYYHLDTLAEHARVEHASELEQAKSE